MRGLLQMLAAVLVVLCGIGAALSFFVLFADSNPANNGANATMLAGSLMSMLLAGAVFLLAEISKALDRKGESEAKDAATEVLKPQA